MGSATPGLACISASQVVNAAARRCRYSSAWWLRAGRAVVQAPLSSLARKGMMKGVVLVYGQLVWWFVKHSRVGGCHVRTHARLLIACVWVCMQALATFLTWPHWL